MRPILLDRARRNLGVPRASKPHTLDGVQLVSTEVLVRLSFPAVLAAPLAVVGLAIALGPTAPARADLAPPPFRSSLTVLDVRALEVFAPIEDRDAAIAQVRAGIGSFHARIERCLSDRGAPLGRGRIRARLRYQRSEQPTRTRVVENQLGPAVAACVSEVLPSLVVRPAPRGELTIELTLAAHPHVRF